MESFGIRGPVPFQNRFAHKSRDSEELVIPLSVVQLAKRCKNLYRFWWCMHYAIGLMGVIAGALLTAITSRGSAEAGSPVLNSLESIAEYSWLIGIVAAVATSLVTFLGPLHKAERYWSAYHHLEQACLEYMGYDADPRLSRLMRKVMQVRKILQVVESNDGIGALNSSRVASVRDVSAVE